MRGGVYMNRLPMTACMYVCMYNMLEQRAKPRRCSLEWMEE